MIIEIFTKTIAPYIPLLMAMACYIYAMIKRVPVPRKIMIGLLALQLIWSIAYFQFGRAIQ